MKKGLIEHVFICSCKLYLFNYSAISQVLDPGDTCDQANAGYSVTGQSISGLDDFPVYIGTGPVNFSYAQCYPVIQPEQDIRLSSNRNPVRPIQRMKRFWYGKFSLAYSTRQLGCSQISGHQIIRIRFDKLHRMNWFPTVLFVTGSKNFTG